MPPPTQIRLLGVSGRFQQVSLFITLRPSMPGKGGTSGTEPVARIILSASNFSCESSFFVTVTDREASTVPRPSNMSILLPFISTPTPPVMRLTTLSLKTTPCFISKVGDWGRLMPNSPNDDMLCNTSAICNIAFEGMQPTFRQVPPRYCFSTMATFAPS